MSISEQVKELRKAAKLLNECKLDYFGGICDEAANTIESLSAKLQAANKEIENLNAIKEVAEEIAENMKWIPCKERLPEENRNVIACFAHGTVTELAFYDGIFHGIYPYNDNVIIAWQPLPEPYHEP